MHDMGYNCTLLMNKLYPLVKFNFFIHYFIPYFGGFIFTFIVQ